ncbi:MAG TPA: hypothetical protein PKM41_15920 [Deltaproteobacteria bacterium]|nr:hypothetical protein [Deltaproteobacteria bacterium]HOI08517.1 hypothetical protein [Deltaproteobacteria bacterium]
MNVIASEKEELKRAIKWVSEHLEEKNEQSLGKLINKAVFTFNLSPADAEYLSHFFHDREKVH